MKPTYIVIPGRSDHHAMSRRFYLQAELRWRVRGMRVKLFEPRWASPEAYDVKLARLLHVIDAERQQGRGVVVVGISAGAALGLLAFHAEPQKISAFVSICGLLAISPELLRDPGDMSTSWFRAGSAAARVQSHLRPEEKRRILTLSARRDSVIAPQRERLAGVEDVRMPVSGHVVAIFVGMMFYRRRIARFVTSIGSV